MKNSQDTRNTGKFLVIDLMNIAHRSYHALKNEQLQTSEGFPTTVCYGVATTFNRVIRELDPTWVAVALDKPGKSFRKDMYPEYKANRNKPDEEFTMQLDTLHEMLGKYGFKCIAFEGYEADDVIGSLSAQYAKPGEVDVYILSNDKDLMQLVGDNVSMVKDDRDDLHFIGPKEVEDKLGCRPDQVVDYLALTGDRSDNIPGVRGVGPKRATALLKNLGTLEGIYKEGFLLIPQNTAQKLEKSQDNAFLSRKLAKIETNLELNTSLEECWFDNSCLSSNSELMSFFQKLEMTSLVNSLAMEASPI